MSGFLLDRFSWESQRGSKICQLEVASGRNQGISPDDATVITHFYSIDIDDGQRSDAVEQALSQIESVAAPLVEQVGRGELPEGTQRAELALFLAVTHLRTPLWRRQTQSLFEQLFTVWSAETTRHRTPDDLRTALGPFAESMTEAELVTMRDEWVADVDAGRAGVELPVNNLIKMFLEQTTNLGWILFCMDWAVVRSESPLILADTPVSIVDFTPVYPESAAGVLSSPNSELFIPLDPHFGLVARPNPATLDAVRELAHDLPKLVDDERLRRVAPFQGRWADGELPTRDILDLNLRTYCRAQRYVYGTQKAVSDAHRYARANPQKRLVLTPQPPRIHILEDHASIPGAMQAWRVFEPDSRDVARRRR